MANISDIVDVSISIADRTPARATLNVPLIASFHSAFPEVVKEYASLTEVAEDFETYEAVYQCAAKLFAQNPTVNRIKVGRLSGSQTSRNVELIPIARDSTTYTIKVNGVEASFTSDASATVAEICAGLVPEINDVAVGGITAADETTKIDISGDVAGVDFFVEVDDVSLWSSIQDVSTSRAGDLTTALEAIEASDSEWYGLITTRANAAEALLCAAFCEARRKVFFSTALNFGSIASAEDNLTDNGTNGLADLKALTYHRTASVFHKQDAHFAGAALAAVCLARDPGSYTAMFKTMPGVEAMSLTSTETAVIEGNNGNHYQDVAGVAIIQKGVAASGRFIDLTIFVDWLHARIQEEIFALMTFMDKVPFTDEGIALVEGVVRKVLQAGVDVGGLVSFETSVPRAANVSAVDKASRYLNSVRFSAVFQGAIHKVRIVGNVSA